MELFIHPNFGRGTSPISVFCIWSFTRSQKLNTMRVNSHRSRHIINSLYFASGPRGVYTVCKGMRGDALVRREIQYASCGGKSKPV
ncbi:hypothetical protein C0J52_25559 [Blattella germanica]|nr:hypothetical protein C0J52_25559 [Blattella germanica]